MEEIDGRSFCWVDLLEDLFMIDGRELIISNNYYPISIFILL